MVAGTGFDHPIVMILPVVQAAWSAGTAFVQEGLRAKMQWVVAQSLGDR
jgi:hypothetical protein